MLNEKEARKRAYNDLINKCKYAKIETEVQNGEIVLVKIQKHIRLDQSYLREKGYLNG